MTKLAGTLNMSRSMEFPRRELSAFERRVSSSGDASVESSKRLCVATPIDVTTIAMPVRAESQIN